MPTFSALAKGPNSPSKDGIFHTRRPLRAIWSIWLLLLLLPPATVSHAQEATAPPPAAALTVRYDAGQDLYLVDIVFTDPGQIGSAHVSVVDEDGIEVTRLSADSVGRNQSQTLAGALLTPGQKYTLSVQAFSPGGLLLGASQGGGALAEAQVVYHPATLGELQLKTENDALAINSDITGAANIAGYRLRMTDEAGNIAREQAFGPALPLRVPLQGLAAGEYQIGLQALGAGDRLLAAVVGTWTLPAGDVLTSPPLFRAAADRQELSVRFPGPDAGEIAAYQIFLIDGLNQIALEAPHTPTIDGNLTVDMSSVPDGEYTVLVRALDGGNRLIAETSGQLVYLGPREPGIFRRMGNGLRANPVLVLFIALLLFALTLFLMVRALLNRRQMATPVLAGWNLPQGTANVAPQLAAPGGTPLAPAQVVPGGQLARGPVPPLEVTVSQSPDKRRAGKTMRVKGYPFTIGRGGSDLDLSGDQHISRRHAELRITAQGLVITDLLSANGTFLNGERIPANTPVPLRTDQPARITVGRESHLLISAAKMA